MVEKYEKLHNLHDIKFETFEVRGDSVYFKVTEKNDWLKSIGIEQLVHDLTIFIVSKGHIKKIITNPSEEIAKEWLNF